MLLSLFTKYVEAFHNFVFYYKSLCLKWQFWISFNISRLQEIKQNLKTCIIFTRNRQVTLAKTWWGHEKVVKQRNNLACAFIQVITLEKIKIMSNAVWTFLRKNHNNILHEMILATGWILLH